jgi:hypothetical protein
MCRAARSSFLHAGEGTVSITQIGEVRRRQPLGFGAAEPAMIAPDLHELPRILIWKGAQQYRAKDAEDRRVGSDADRQCEHGDDRKRRRPAQHTQSDAQILPDLVDPLPRAPSFDRAVVELLHRGLDLAVVAEGFERGLARCLRRHAGGFELLRTHLEVERDLALDFLFAAVR